jgi:hypothetical protein
LRATRYLKLTFLFFLILILIFAEGACISKEMVDPVDASPVFSGPSKERKGITSTGYKKMLYSEKKNLDLDKAKVHIPYQ